MTGLESCSITAPSPFLEALVCRVVALFGLKYGRVMFLDISSFVLEKATCTEFVSSNSAPACRSLWEVHLTLLNVDWTCWDSWQVWGNFSLSPHLEVNSSFSLLQSSLDLDWVPLHSTGVQRMKLVEVWTASCLDSRSVYSFCRLPESWSDVCHAPGHSSHKWPYCQLCLWLLECQGKFHLITSEKHLGQQWIPLAAWSTEIYQCLEPSLCTSLILDLIPPSSILYWNQQ